MQRNLFLIVVSALVGALSALIVQPIIEDYRHRNALAAQNEKIRLDLYNRRFEIFSSTLDLYHALVYWKDEGTPEQVAAMARFFRAYKESGFLFRQESGIEHLLKKMNEDAVKVVGFKASRELASADQAMYAKQFDDINHILVTTFPEQLQKVKLAMAGYLNFQHIER